jgi:hypothetical protein
LSGVHVPVASHSNRELCFMLKSAINDLFKTNDRLGKICSGLTKGCVRKWSPYLQAQMVPTHRLASLGDSWQFPPARISVIQPSDQIKDYSFVRSNNADIRLQMALIESGNNC